MTRKLGLIVLAAVLLTTVQAAAKGPTAPRTVFGIVWQNRQTSLVELDALTLRPVSKAVPLGKAGRYLGRPSGNGMRAVRAAFIVGESGNAIRFVDLDAMKAGRRVALPCSVRNPVLWETADRLVAACSSGWGSSILVLDPIRQRLVSRKELDGSLVNVQVAGGVLAGLLAPSYGIGAAQLLVVDRAGSLRTAALPGIRAGIDTPDPGDRVRIESPALAVQPSGRRAAVVPASGAVTVVDLDTLAAETHALSARNLAARKKNVEGTDRTALWTWSNTIAVTGRDWSADGTPDHSTPAGLTLIDAGTWTSSTLDDGAVEVSYTGPGGMLLSFGGVWDYANQKSVGDGLTAYSPEGTRRYHLFGSDAIWITVAGTYAYVASDDFRHFRIVDTTSGSVVAEPHTAKSTTLAPMSSAF